MALDQRTEKVCTIFFLALKKRNIVHTLKPLTTHPRAKNKPAIRCAATDCGFCSIIRIRWWRWASESRPKGRG